jgi:hypothetical protein
VKILYFSRDYTPHDYRFLAALAATKHKVAYLRLERGGIQLEDRPLPAQIEIIPWSGGNRVFTLRDPSCAGSSPTWCKLARYSGQPCWLPWRAPDRW